MLGCSSNVPVMKKIALHVCNSSYHGCMRPAPASSLLGDGHDAVEPSMHKTRVHRRENAVPEHTARISDAHTPETTTTSKHDPHPTTHTHIFHNTHNNLVKEIWSGKMFHNTHLDLVMCQCHMLHVKFCVSRFVHHCR